MDHYPKRTFESDNKAKALKVALDSYPNAPVNYMVAVAVTDSGACFIATSGSALSRIERELTARFHWFRLFDEPPITFGPETPEDAKVRKATNQKLKSLAKPPSRNRTKARIPDFATATSADKSPSTMFPLRNGMVEPNYRPQDFPRMRMQGSVLSGQLRDCAEPKALLAAAEAAARVTGMTTYWYSRGRQNDYPDLSMPVAGVDIAVPCEFCRVNAARIMRRVEEVFARERNLPMPRAFEV